MSRIRVLRWSLLPAVVLLVSAGAAHAASRSIGDRFERSGDSRVAARVVHPLPAGMGGGARYVYAEDGTCPDGIDVFQAADRELNFLQHVQVGCTDEYDAGWAGAHYLAVVTDPADCLVYSDAGDGAVDTFTIDPSTGLLSSAPVSSVPVDGEPADLAVSGSMVFSSVIASPFAIDVLTVGAGCGLTLDSQNSQGVPYTYDIALASPTSVVSCDSYHGQMFAYTLQANETLLQTVASPEGLCGGVGLVATNAGTHTLVFTGGGTDLGTELEGFDFDGSAFTPLPGSPQKMREDSGTQAGAVALSLPNLLLVQGQYDGNSGSQISWDTLAGGAMRYYGGHTPPLPGNLFPAEMTVAGNVLLVADYSTSLAACSLASSGVSDCRVVASLTAPDPGHSNGGSTAIFYDRSD